MPNPQEDWSPTLSAPGTGFMEDNFSIDRWQGEYGLGIIQACYIYCALYYCCYIIPTSDRQVLDPGGWGPLP